MKKFNKFRIKVCGMKEAENIRQLVTLKPDFIGFIFYEKSKRYVGEDFKIDKLNIDKPIQKTGVFVNASENYILEKVNKYKLDLVQLHGDETPEFCQKLFLKGIKISKAFQISYDFNFTQLNDYKPVCNYFLFDTKNKNYGGSGHKFNWEILKKYDNEKPFFLSGGINLEDVPAIKQLTDLNLFAIDINSKFELKPGLKDIGKIGQFMLELNMVEV